MRIENLEQLDEFVATRRELDDKITAINWQFKRSYPNVKKWTLWDSDNGRKSIEVDSYGLNTDGIEDEAVVHFPAEYLFMNIEEVKNLVAEYENEIDRLRNEHAQLLEQTRGHRARVQYESFVHTEDSHYPIKSKNMYN